MASPQLENGYIRIANELIDKFSKYRLSGEEWQILWVIIKKTWGWGKKFDRISFSQFAKETGIARPHCHRLLQSLIKKEIVIKGVTKNGNREVITYGFQKNYERWKVLPKMVTDDKSVTKNGNKVLPKMVTEVLPKMVTTKYILKKPYTKEIILSQIKNLLTLFPDEIKNLILEYIEIAKQENKNKTITLQKEFRLINEIYQIYRVDKNKNKFQQALKITVKKNVAHINYFKKVRKNLEKNL